MSRLGVGERAIRADRIRKKQKTITAIQKAGCKVEVINREIHHYRITGPKGGQIDFWISTETWLFRHDYRERGGQGLESMLARIADMEPVPQVGRENGDFENSMAVFADASWHQVSKAGGWGGWWKSGAMEYGKTAGGPIKQPLVGSTQAEAVAIANTLAIAKSSGDLKPGMTVMIQSDCKNVLDAILKVVPDARDRPKGLACQPARRLEPQLRDHASLDFIADLVKRLELKIMTRHVPGHRRGDGRQWVNRKCDELARKGRLQAEAEQARQNTGNAA